MARVRILVGVADKYTGALYRAGQIVEFEDGRAAEICSTPYAMLIDDKPAKKTRKKKKAAADA